MLENIFNQFGKALKFEAWHKIKIRANLSFLSPFPTRHMSNKHFPFKVKNWGGLRCFRTPKMPQPK